MAKETKTASKDTGSNLTPIIIIGAIFLATIGGIYMISQSGDDSTETAKKDTNSTKTGDKPTSSYGTDIANYNSASLGASPAHFKGSESAAVVIEEFADFQCPTCKTYHSVIKEVISKYGSRVKVIYRQNPIPQIHPNAYDASVASEAAGLQGKFWEMQNIIFNNQGNWSNAPNAKQLFAGYAKSIGLDVEKYGNDILGLQTKSRVDADLKRGRELGVQSTPSIVMNGKMMNFSKINNLATISKAIDEELARTDPKDESQTKTSEESSDKKEDDTSEDKGVDKADK